MMKLSSEALQVLKNFSDINNNFMFQRGRIQRTIAVDDSLVVEADFGEEAPQDFGIYDLRQFLGNIQALNAPDLTFKDKEMIMSDPMISISYRETSPDLLTVVPPNKKLMKAKPDVKFVLPEQTLSRMLRLGIVNDFPHVAFVARKGKVSIQVYDRSNDTTDRATANLDVKVETKDFEAVLKREHLKIIPGEYEIQIVIDNFVVFKGVNRPITYYAPLEA